MPTASDIPHVSEAPEQALTATPSPPQQDGPELPSAVQDIGLTSPWAAPKTSIAHGESHYSSPGTTSDSTSLLSRMVSQDIYLCTTIDLMGANEESFRPSFAYFQRSVQSPHLTPYDSCSWQCFKDHAVNLASHYAPLAAAALSIQALYRAHQNGLSVTKALALYGATKDMLTTALERTGDHDSGILLILSFLLHLGEMLLPDDIGPGPLADEEGPLINHLQNLTTQTHHTSINMRIASWLLICHAAARRGGNKGLLSKSAQNILRRICISTELLPPLTPTSPPTLHESILHSLSEPLYNFYFQFQLLSSQVADLSHYHRSRITSEDQDEVATLIAGLKTSMEYLWDHRPTTMRSSPADIRSSLSPDISEPLLLQTAICTSAYHNEIVEIGRNLSDPPFASPEARGHLAAIRSIIENPEWPVHTRDTTLHPAFTRPLFLYAIESIHASETQWAVDRLHTIKDPISRSDFFASYAEGLAQAQREKGRRVTTKWWCWRAFGVNPPYLSFDIKPSLLRVTCLTPVKAKFRPSSSFIHRSNPSSSPPLAASPFASPAAPRTPVFINNASFLRLLTFTHRQNTHAAHAANVSAISSTNTSTRGFQTCGRILLPPPTDPSPKGLDALAHDV